MACFVVDVHGPLAPLLDDLDLLLDQLPCRSDFLGSFEGEKIPQQRNLEGFSGDQSFASLDAEFEREPLLTFKIYFSTEKSAQQFASLLLKESQTETSPALQISISEMADSNWNQIWSDSFEGCSVEPFWNILPVRKKNSEIQSRRDTKQIIYLNPSIGFGSGTHPTTALCLKQIGIWSAMNEFRGSSFLDFGSGSGILSIAAALKGARVTAVEIDTMALEHSREMAEENGVADGIHFAEEIPQNQKYQFIAANILMRTLLEFAPKLVQQLLPGGHIGLSGILHDQVHDIESVFAREFISQGRVSKLSVLNEKEWHLILIEDKAN